MKTKEEQLALISRHLPTISTFARTEFNAQGRGMVVVMVDGLLDEGVEQKIPMYYMSERASAKVGPDAWKMSDERKFVRAYRPKVEFVIQFMWSVGPDNECQWNTFRLSSAADRQGEQTAQTSVCANDAQYLDPSSEMAHKMFQQLWGKAEETQA
jgi:hypothetical protein